jgi:hypothetical protein
MLLANLVAQRTREIGIRIALGWTVSTTMSTSAARDSGLQRSGSSLGWHYA